MPMLNSFVNMRNASDVPVALNSSSPYFTSTVVCQPNASFEQHARKRRVMYSYTFFSSPTRLPAYAVG